MLLQTPHARQGTLDDLGTPLAEVTFCVLDLETTGGSPSDSSITEVGALCLRRGEVLGTFQTLVDPGMAVPAFVRLLTGIDDQMLVGAPSISAVLPSLLEFLGSHVLVAHNARFDRAFLAAALEREGYPPLTNRVVDTAALARKILAGEVRDHKLGTLAQHFRCIHQPRHRALEDARATGELLHHLIERVSGFGVTTLEDLLAMSAARLARSFSKISLTEGLPRGPGVYRFVGAGGRTLYVGKASDIRSRVRSYFFSDDRRGIKGLLRETQSIEAETTSTTLEAEVLEKRILLQDTPPYNRVGKKKSSWYIRIQPGQRLRIRPARAASDRRSFYFGPLPSAETARDIICALQDAFPVHRCTFPHLCKGCAFSEMGACAGSDIQNHRRAVLQSLECLIGGPSTASIALYDKMVGQASRQHFEQAAETRDRALRLGRTIARVAEATGLKDCGELVLLTKGTLVLIRNGLLVGVAPASDPLDEAVSRLRSTGDAGGGPEVLCSRVYSEALTISRWIARNSREVRILHAGDGWSVARGARPPDLFNPR